MQLDIPANADSVIEIQEYYESFGLQFLGKAKIDKDYFMLSFYCSDKDLGADIVNMHPGVTSYLTFEDGTSSPLFIRKNRDWSE